MIKIRTRRTNVKKRIMNVRSKIKVRLKVFIEKFEY